MTENDVVIKVLSDALGEAEDNAHRFKVSGNPSEYWEEKRDLLRVALRKAKK